MNQYKVSYLDLASGLRWACRVSAASAQQAMDSVKARYPLFSINVLSAVKA